jgi:hypothetical protein
LNHFVILNVGHLKITLAGYFRSLSRIENPFGYQQEVAMPSGQSRVSEGSPPSRNSAACITVMNVLQHNEMSTDAFLANNKSCLKRLILFGENSLRTAARKFIGHYLGERHHFELFNAFNRVVFGSPALNIINSNFGPMTGQANRPEKWTSRLEIHFLTSCAPGNSMALIEGNRLSPETT